MTITTDQEKGLRELVFLAGEKLLKFWPGSGAAGLSITIKEDGSPVTEADIASNTIISEGIERLFPKDSIISEEGEAGAPRGSSNVAWVIDPLDGTNSFISGSSDFSILVSRVEGDEAVYGIMYFPVLNLFVSAGKGRGAFLNGARLNVSSSRKIREKAFYHRGFEPLDSRISLGEKLDSGRAFLSLCEGNLDGIIIAAGRFGEHDFAAPAVVIQESGGVITDEDGSPVRFYLRKPDYRYLIASNQPLHPTLLQMLKEGNDR